MSVKGIWVATVQYRLDEDFKPYDLTTWHHHAELGDIAVIALPKRACKVQLIRGYRDSVCWWPEGGRSMTISVENAILRLAMLQVHPRS
jgi:hypothetical protein